MWEGGRSRASLSTQCWRAISYLCRLLLFFCDNVSRDARPSAVATVESEDPLVREERRRSFFRLKRPQQLNKHIWYAFGRNVLHVSGNLEAIVVLSRQSQRKTRLSMSRPDVEPNNSSAESFYSCRTTITAGRRTTSTVLLLYSAFLAWSDLGCSMKIDKQKPCPGRIWQNDRCLCF